MKLPHRLSIAGLMAIILICALGLVALRSRSAAWAGGIYLVTYAVLLLAIVGAICRPAAERPGWLGFALFGVAYFRFSESLGFRIFKLPTMSLLELIRPAGVDPFGGFGDGGYGYYYLVGHCLWSLLAAMCGGFLASALFASPKANRAEDVPAPRRETRSNRGRWRQAAVVGLAVLVPGSASILVVTRAEPAFWATSLYLATWALFGVAALGFACGRGRRRMVWFGAALFGLGYMVLNRSGDGFEQSSYVHLVADELLEAARPLLPEVVRGFPAKTAAMAHENARIRRLLDREVPMRFPEPTALGIILDHVRAATMAANGRKMPIYVNPEALADADKTMQSTVQLDLEGCSLDATLRIALRQVRLIPYVVNGMLYITSDQSDDKPSEIDYYLLVGHCFLAMLAAGLGALVVPLVAHREV